MLKEETVLRATGYWAAHLGCEASELFTESIRVVTHSRELSDYPGVFALFRGGAATVSVPSGGAESFRRLLPTQSTTPARFTEAFRLDKFTVIGPAYIGYAEAIRWPSHPARLLTRRDASAAAALRAACNDVEWDHGGSCVEEHPASGVFAGDQLIALAGYEVWGGILAHISVITHPAFRRHGFGRNAVAHLAAAALAAGLVPQYRTLESNQASLRIAETLGFHRYATSVAVRPNLDTAAS
jgi:GNAT superfamily N-acetyltransferase